MTDSQREVEIGTDDHVEIDNDSHPGERAQRLQLMVVYLLEKNEQLRMQSVELKRRRELNAITFISRPFLSRIKAGGGCFLSVVWDWIGGRVHVPAIEQACQKFT